MEAQGNVDIFDGETSHVEEKEMDTKKSLRDLIVDDKTEDLIVLCFIGLITLGCLSGIIVMEKPPEILNTMASGGFGAFLMKAKSVVTVQK